MKLSNNIRQIGNAGQSKNGVAGVGQHGLRPNSTASFQLAYDGEAGANVAIFGAQDLAIPGMIQNGIYVQTDIAGIKLEMTCGDLASAFSDNPDQVNAMLWDLQLTTTADKKIVRIEPGFSACRVTFPDGTAGVASFLGI